MEPTKKNNKYLQKLELVLDQDVLQIESLISRKPTSSNRAEINKWKEDANKWLTKLNQWQRDDQLKESQKAMKLINYAINNLNNCKQALDNVGVAKKSEKNSAIASKPNYILDEFKRYEQLNMLTRKVRNYEQIEDWLKEADEWQCKFSDWLNDAEFKKNHPQVFNKIDDELCLLIERYEELDDKKESWLQRCSFNRAYFYPKHGIELGNDGFDKMLFYDDIDNFEEWSYLAEKTDQVSSDKEEFDEQDDLVSRPSEREQDRMKIKQWSFDSDSKSAKTSIESLQKLVDKVYNQKDTEKLRSAIVRDLLVDKLPPWMYSKFENLSTTEECIKAIETISK